MFRNLYAKVIYIATRVSHNCLVLRHILWMQANDNRNNELPKRKHVTFCSYGWTIGNFGCSFIFFFLSQDW